MTRRRGIRVALVGADGAGKTTLARRLEASGPVPARYIYMGLNPATSNHMLPTTRLWIALKKLMGRKTDDGGPPDPEAAAARTKSAKGWRRPFSAVKAGLNLVHRLSEEWYRQFIAWVYIRRGLVVIFDRHFFWDYYAHDVAPGKSLPFGRRVHGWFLQNWYPRPDHVVVLDAPAEVLFARKGEGTIELLNRRRQEYLDLCAQSDNARIVDVTQELAAVESELGEILKSLMEADLE